MGGFAGIILSLAAQAGWGDKAEPAQSLRDGTDQARLFMAILGVDTARVDVTYHASADPPEKMGQLRMTRGAWAHVAINVQAHPKHLDTPFHEYWHYFQARFYDNGENPRTCERSPYHNSPFGCAYRDEHHEEGYEENPFEKEAFLVGDAMAKLFIVPEDPSKPLVPRNPRTYIRDLIATLTALLPQLEAIWKDEGIEPTHLREFRERLDRARAMQDQPEFWKQLVEPRPRWRRWLDGATDTMNRLSEKSIDFIYAVDRAVARAWKAICDAAKATWEAIQAFGRWVADFLGWAGGRIPHPSPPIPAPTEWNPRPAAPPPEPKPARGPVDGIIDRVNELVPVDVE